MSPVTVTAAGVACEVVGGRAVVVEETAETETGCMMLLSDTLSMTMILSGK